MSAVIADLALELHAQRGEVLVISLPEGERPPDTTGTPGVSVEGGQLHFASLAERNRVVAAATLERLGADVHDGAKLLAAAYCLWRDEIGHDDQACGRLLAGAESSADVLQQASAQIDAGGDVFDILHCIEAMFPYVDALPLPSLVALTRAQHPRTERDLAGGVFFTAVRDWLAPRLAAARELAQLLLDQPEESTANLLGSAWLAWHARDPSGAAASVIQAAVRDHPLLPGVCAWVAGRMLDADKLPEAQALELEHLILRSIAGAEQAQRRAGLSAATQLLHRRRGFDAALRERLQQRDPDSLAYVAMGVAQHAKAHVAAGTFFEWIGPCQYLPQDFGSAIGQLDHELARLLKAGGEPREQVLGFLAAWLESQPAAGAHDRRLVELFDICARTILDNEALLRRVLTDWLLDERRALAAAAAALLSELRRPGASARVAFDASRLDAASREDLLLLARRLIGFVLDPQQLLSLALSLLGVKDAATRVHPFMSSLLGDEIGYDYPGTTIERLSQASEAADAATKALLDGIRERLQAHMDAIDALPRRKELAPPPALAREFRKARAKQMYKAMRDAQAKSVFSQIVTQVHIKAGAGSFQYFQGGFTEPMHMKETSVAMEVPRRETLDPLGNAYRMHLNRSARRSDK